MDTTKLKGDFGDYANAPENSENHFPHRRLHCGLRFERRVRCLHSHPGAGPPGSGSRTALCPTTTTPSLQKALADIQEFPQALRKPTQLWMFPIVEPWKICYCRNRHCSVMGDHGANLPNVLKVQEAGGRPVSVNLVLPLFNFSFHSNIISANRWSNLRCKSWMDLRPWYIIISQVQDHHPLLFFGAYRKCSGHIETVR